MGGAGLRGELGLRVTRLVTLSLREFDMTFSFARNTVAELLWITCAVLVDGGERLTGERLAMREGTRPGFLVWGTPEAAWDMSLRCTSL